MMAALIKGRIWVYGDNVNTDNIFPGKYTYTVQDPTEMARYALEDLDPTFRDAVQPGDIIVAGKNWGCGSSREQAVICLKQIGIGALIAESFARIYYRNCINNALPAIICPEYVASAQKGENLTIDLDRGVIESSIGSYSFQPLPPVVQEIFNHGGLIEYTRHCLSAPEHQNNPIADN